MLLWIPSYRFELYQKAAFGQTFCNHSLDRPDFPMGIQSRVEALEEVQSSAGPFFWENEDFEFTDITLSLTTHVKEATLLPMLHKNNHIHFIGIGGIGMSAVARILMEKGLKVSGSDVKESCLTIALRQEGATVTIGHCPQNVHGADVVVYSGAVASDNVERQEASRLGLRTVHRAEVLGATLEEYGGPGIGITGTHGKGTTSAMIAWILETAGMKPGFIIGAIPHNFGCNARWGAGRVMVAEVDESDGSHLKTRPRIVVCHNLELDHLNYYKDLDDIISTQCRFIGENPLLTELHLNMGDPGVQRLAGNLTTPYIGYAVADDPLSVQAEVVASEVEANEFGYSFTVTFRGKQMGRAEINLPGAYNVENALASLSVTLCMGIPFPVAAQALASFTGLENRFSVVRAGDVTIVKDYLSHPTGMKQVLASARKLCRGTLWAVYKPYRFTLLKYLGDEYACAFQCADQVILTDLFTAGEEPIPGIDPHYLNRMVQEKGVPVSHVPLTEQIPDFLREKLQSGDVVVFFGGDDFFQMADQFVRDLDQLHHHP